MEVCGVTVADVDDVRMIFENIVNDHISDLRPTEFVAWPLQRSRRMAMDLFLPIPAANDLRCHCYGRSLGIDTILTAETPSGPTAVSPAGF